MLFVSRMTRLCRMHIWKSPDVHGYTNTEHCVCTAPYTVIVPEHWLCLRLSAQQIASTFMLCWFVSVFVDIRAAPWHEVHLRSDKRSHTDSVFGIKWTAGRMVSVPSHNRARTLLVVFIVVVAISSCLQRLLVQVAHPCSCQDR